MKLVVLDGQAVNPGDLSWESLNQFGDLTVYQQTTTFSDTVARIGDAEIVIINKTPITEAVLQACHGIRLICVLATGYNVVDCDAAAKRRIPVCNVPGYGTAAVAQFTIGLLLELCNRIGEHDRLVHDGKWCESPHFCYWATPQIELAGKTMGIIGFGAIGRAVGTIAKALGMDVLAYSRTEYPEGRAIGRYVDLETLLKESDVVSLHCPLFPETTGIINTETISKMKDGAFLLNTSRGPLINEEAVKNALLSGKLRGAAMDVVSVEPITRDNPLLAAPNCIITGHMAWAPVETRQRIIERTAESISGFLSDKPVNVVNL